MKWILEKTGYCIYFKFKKLLATLLRERTRHPVYTRRRVYTSSPRFLLSYPWERREGTNPWLASPTGPRCPQLSRPGGVMGEGRQRRGALPPRSSSRSPFSLVASPFESIRLPPSVRLISVFFHRTPTPPEIVLLLSFSLSSSRPLLLFLTFNSALSGSDLYLFVTTARTHLWTFVKYVSASRW